MDGYSIVLFEGGITAAITLLEAKYFERSDDLAADKVLR